MTDHIDTDFLSTRQQLFFDVVKHWHGEQKCKYTGQPYWHHLLNVAHSVYQNIQAEWVIEIALGHDLFEDTEITVDQLTAEMKIIGYNGFDIHKITNGIKDLTDTHTKKDYPFLNRKARKQKEAVRLGMTKSYIQSIKLADLIDNSISILTHDKKFAPIYLAEKLQILDAMRNGNISLYIEACFVVRQGLLQLNELEKNNAAN